MQNHGSASGARIVRRPHGGGMTVRAALSLRAGEPLVLEEVKLEDPQAGEVLIEMRAVGLCHSDLTSIDHPTTSLPAIYGHEGAGVVVRCGPGVEGVAPGDHVVTFCLPHCGRCRYCAAGRTNYCEDAQPGFMGSGGRFSYGGRHVSTFGGLGAFAKALVVKASQAVRVRRDIPFEQLCLLGCGGATGIGAAIRVADVRPGSRVAVLGLGGVGLNVVQGARLKGAQTIIGVDLDSGREEVSRRLGMTHFIDASAVSSLADSLRDIAGGDLDDVFECVGSLALVSEAIKSCDTYSGRVTLVGYMQPGDLTLRTTDLFFGRRVGGAFLGGLVGVRDLPRLADHLANGDLNFDALISCRLPFERINEGFELMRRGGGVRTVVTF